MDVHDTCQINVTTSQYKFNNSISSWRNCRNMKRFWRAPLMSKKCIRVWEWTGWWVAGMILLLPHPHPKKIYIGSWEETKLLSQCRRNKSWSLFVWGPMHKSVRERISIGVHECCCSCCCCLSLCLVAILTAPSQQKQTRTKQEKLTKTRTLHWILSQSWSCLFATPTNIWCRYGHAHSRCRH